MMWNVPEKENTLEWSDMRCIIVELQEGLNSLNRIRSLSVRVLEMMIEIFNSQIP